MPYWKGAGELIHLMSVISPIADDLAVVFMPLFPCGLLELLQERDVRLVEVPEEEFLTLGCNVLAVRPRRRGRWPMATRSRDAAGGSGSRGARLPGRRGRGERQRRADVPDPADAARMKNLSPAELAVVAAVDRDRIGDDLAALVRIPSVTGEEAAVQTEAALRMAHAGLEVTRDRRRPGGVGRRSRLPGMEAPRTALPVVAGAVGSDAPTGG